MEKNISNKEMKGKTFAKKKAKNKIPLKFHKKITAFYNQMAGKKLCKLKIPPRHFSIGLPLSLLEVNLWKMVHFSIIELDCTLNQSKIEEITLREEPMKVSALEDYFDDEGFGEMDNDSSG